MSPTVSMGQHLHLEEFPSFVSGIKCFGRPIIPPLITQDRREILSKLRNAAIQKEIEFSNLKKKASAVKKLDFSASSVCTSEFETSNTEACAFLYSSSQEKYASVAISKIPTSNILSSVHTDAIVCAGVIENNGKHTAKKVLSENPQCSHFKMVLDCPLCQAENDRSFQNHGFISPEVPCRVDSLATSSQSFVEDDSLAETDCESLPTVICSQKPDTDTESSVTCFTQSTDLEKYMEVSSDLNSSDNSATAWDSQSTSQQFTMSRSEEASSGTMVNTENELTPCASTLAEFTDNIEDELSITDDTAQDARPFGLKRAQSVDSYMKMIQMCAKGAQVKKSTSDPLNASFKSTSHYNDMKVLDLSKAGQLIKEDSKESEESIGLPEKDLSVSDVHLLVSPLPKNMPPSDFGEENLLQKNHVRRNSYTLDHPSPVLIQAHADCNCSFETNSSSPPHCSALQDKDVSNAAFTKEKVEINIPASFESYPMLNADDSVAEVNKEALSCEMNTASNMNEEVFDKSHSENEYHDTLKNENADEKAAEVKGCSSFQEKIESRKKLFPSPPTSSTDLSQEYLKYICKELQEHYEAQVKELMEEQNKQLMKLTLEYKEKEKLLYKNLKHSPSSLQGASLPASQSLKDRDSVPVKDVSTVLPFSYGESQDLSVKNVNQLQLDEQKMFYSQVKQNQSSKSPSCTPSSNLPLNPDHTETARAVFSPSKSYKNYQNNPSANLETSFCSEINQHSSVSLHGNDETCRDPCLGNNNSFSSENMFPYPSAVLLPQCDNQRYTCVDLDSPCVCEKPLPLCSCLESSSCFENVHDHINSYPGVGSLSNSSPHPLPAEANQGNCELSAVVDSSNLYAVASDEQSRISKSSENVSREMKSSDVFQHLNPSNRKLTKSTSALTLDVPVNDIISLCVKSVKNVSSVGMYNPKKIEIPPSILKRFEKLPAFVKGYLTRRLFKTEGVQNLIKTLQDTAVLIRKVSEDISLKGSEVSEKDVILHRQLIVQLMTTFHNVYDIFCTISTKEQMSIISESRNSRLKKETEQKTVPVSSQESVSNLSKKPKISSTTTKALDKKRRLALNSRTYTIDDMKSLRSRSAIDSRTYTIDDLKSRVGRSKSQASSKSHPSSPSSIYKATVGLAHKRKTAICKPSSSRRSVQHNWVP